MTGWEEAQGPSTRLGPASPVLRLGRDDRAFYLIDDKGGRRGRAALQGRVNRWKQVRALAPVVVLL